MRTKLREQLIYYLNMDVLDSHLRTLSLKEYRDLIKTLKLRKELPKNYSKLPKSELYNAVKPLLKSVNDGDKILITVKGKNGSKTKYELDAEVGLEFIKRYKSFDMIGGNKIGYVPRSLLTEIL